MEKTVLIRIRLKVIKASWPFVTVLGGGGQGFCIDCIKRDNVGVKNCQQLRDVIYGRPLTIIYFQRKLYKIEYLCMNSDSRSSSALSVEVDNLVASKAERRFSTLG